MSDAPGADNDILIQAEINGYGGPAVNLLGVLDAQTGFIIISQELKIGVRVPGALFTTNDARAPGRDRHFVEDLFSSSIRTFFRATSMQMLEIMPKVSKHDPTRKIEAAGVDEHGTKYRLAPDIPNGCVAVLALVDAAESSRAAADGNSMAEEIASMFFSI